MVFHVVGLNEHIHGQALNNLAVEIMQDLVLHRWFVSALIGAYLFLPLTD